MKVIIVIPRMNSGGAERVTSHIANKLSDLNNTVYLLTFTSNESFYKLNNNIFFLSADCKINRKNKLSRLLSLVYNVRKASKFVQNTINTVRPDTVLSMLPAADVITYLSKKNSPAKPFRWIASERNDPRQRSMLLQLFLKKIYTKTDSFVCQSKTVFGYYSNIKHKVVIPNPLDISSLPPVQEEISNNTIVSVGRLAPQKNFKLLIDSFTAANIKLNHSLKLYIFGDGPLRKRLQKQIIFLKQENSIFLYGRQTDVLKKINGTTLFVMSSNYEGFPNALLEAMAMGLPVISTDFASGVARELISPQNGIITPINDKNAMADAIINIINNKQERSEMRKNNAYVREMFDLNKIIGKWIEIIR